MTEFTARVVGESEENDVYIIGVTDTLTPEDTSQSIQFQRSDYITEQEVKLGWDTHCIVTDPGANVHYGGVLSWGLKDRVLVVRLEEQAAANVELDEVVRLDLRELDQDSVKKLEAGLTRVLVDVPRDDELVDAQPQGPAA